MKKAQSTRLSILQKAFELIYTQGYLTTSIDDIIATTKVTKGAFYYHFKTKDEMGLAIINELLHPTMKEAFILPLKNSSDPQKDIYKMLRHLLLENPVLKTAYGCPAANFTYEMTPWNAHFSEALSGLTSEWENALRSSVNNGKKSGRIRMDVKATDVAYFIMSGYWGIRNFGKLGSGDASYRIWLRELKNYLKNLG